MELVSVVVPVYNAATYLPKCVDSLLQQSHAHLEVVLVDDASTDDSLSVCRELASRDERVRIVERDVNGGLSAARNSGLDVARGDFVQFLDADDWAEFRMIELSLQQLVTTEADVLVSGFHVDLAGENDQLTATTARRLSRMVLGTLSLSGQAGLVTPELLGALGYAWNKLYRKSVLDRHQARFSEGTSLVEDVLFNASLFRAVGRVVTWEMAFVHYVQRQGASLGRRHYPNYAELIRQADEQLAMTLQHWGLTVAEVRAVTVPTRAVAIVRGCRSATLQRSSPIGRRVAEVEKIAVELDAVGLLAEAVGHLPRRHQLVLWLVSHQHTKSAMLLLAVGNMRHLS